MVGLFISGYRYFVTVFFCSQEGGTLNIAAPVCVCQCSFYFGVSRGVGQHSTRRGFAMQPLREVLSLPPPRERSQPRRQDRFLPSRPMRSDVPVSLPVFCFCFFLVWL